MRAIIPIDYVPEGSKLTFVKQTQRNGKTPEGKNFFAKAMYRCECGKEKEIAISIVKGGHTTSCGCWIMGESYVPEGSRLTFIRQTVKWHKLDNGKDSPTRALYLCACGNEVEIPMSHVKGGTTKSCGCLHIERTKKSRTKHGLRGHPLYFVWKSMNQRCSDINGTYSKNYVERGVRVCDEWKNDFKLFYDWAISKGWTEGLEIDKDEIPKKLGIPALLYSPGMCSILTKKENMNATRRNHPITFQGETKNICQWQESLGFKSHTIISRLKRGWSLEKTMSTPVKKTYRNRITKKLAVSIKHLHMIGYRNKSIANQFNIDPTSVSKIINHG